MKTGPLTRLNILGGALTLAGLFIFVWMIQIQTSVYAKDLSQINDSFTYVRKIIYPERGHIYDRWGRLLAGSSEVYELGLNLPDVTDPENIADTVSSVVGMNRTEVLDLIKTSLATERLVYITLKKDVTPEQIQELATLQKQLSDQAAKSSAKELDELPSLGGLLWTPRLQRTYPEYSLASSILGFFAYRDLDSGQGYFGVEQKYNHLLAGAPVEIYVSPDPYKMMDNQPTVPPGVSLVLTIDREIQAMVEEVLDRAVTENGAESGTVVIMDPRNGEILAMASTPRLNLNEYWKYGEVFPAPTPFNRAVEQTYEPGSVFKVITMAAGLDSGTVSRDSEFLDTGVINVGGVNIHNWDRRAWGPQSMTGCLQHSLNVCMANIAVEMGPSTFYSYLQRFGIGHKTGIDISGEVNYPLSTTGDPNWYPVNLGTNSFGQGLSTTPIQMVTAISAIANNEGKMMSPHVLKAMVEEGEQYSNSPQIISNPITAETARTLSEMLAVSLETEASDALVEGYRVAGKTGTAEIAGPDGYTSSLTNASFVGWGPIDDPRFIVYVWLEKPTTSMWGSVVASPVFSEIVSKLVILMDLPPDAVRQQLAAQTGQ